MHVEREWLHPTKPRAREPSDSMWVSGQQLVPWRIAYGFLRNLK